jgi:hypothetical protein
MVGVTNFYFCTLHRLVKKSSLNLSHQILAKTTGVGLIFKNTSFQVYFLEANARQAGLKQNNWMVSSM